MTTAADRTLQPGALVYLEYDEAGEPWHEAMLVKAVEPGLPWWVIRTPDADEYVECLQLDGFRGLRVATDHRLPPGLGARAGAPVYRFAPRPTRADLDGAIARADAVIAAARAEDPPRFGLPAAAPPGVAVPPLAGPLVAGGGAGAGGAGAGHGDAGAGGGAGAAWDAPPGEWVVITGGPGLGIVLPDHQVSAYADKLRLGNFALVRGAAAAPDEVIVLQRVAVGGAGAVKDEFAALFPPEVATPRAEPADARIQPVMTAANGERFFEFHKHVARCKRETFDGKAWPLTGPRTVPYHAGEIAKLGVGAVTRHRTWVNENHLKEDESATHLHEVCSEVYELMVCIDQLDVFNLCCCEALVRHMQFVEHGVKKRRESRSPTAGADTSEYWLARPRSLGGAIISPELTEFIAKKAAADSAILKEQRKIIEERAAAAKAKPKAKAGKESSDS